MTHEEKENIWNSIQLLYEWQQKDPNKYSKNFVIVSNDNYYKFIYSNNTYIETIKIAKEWRLTSNSVFYQIIEKQDRIEHFLSFIKPFIREIKLINIGINRD